MWTRIFLFGLLTISSFPLPSSAQQLWTGILDPSRAINWSQAGAGLIPTRTTICSTLNPGATVAQVNTAIANCPSGQVVFLNAGNYKFAGQVFFNNKSNVTLRGAGPDQTFVQFTTQGGCNGLQADVCIMNGDNNYGGDPHNVATWTAGYAPGSTSITLGAVTTGSISTLQVGSLIILDQKDDTTDTGNIYVCQTYGANGDCNQQGGVSGRPGRGGFQTVTVTSISGSGPWTIGISPGIYAPNWRNSQAPGAWWSGALPVTGDGVENISLNHEGSNGSGVYGMGIQFVNATDGWVNNVRSLNDLNGVSEHIQAFQSTHITVENSYFYGSNPASEGYGVACDFNSSDNLFINNVFNHIASPLMMQGCVGGVFAFNTATDDYFGGNWQQGDSHHSIGDMYDLFEGNEDIMFTADDIHGTSNMLTFYRNYYNGHDPATETGGKTDNTTAMNLSAYSRYYNLVGNAFGTASYHKVYTDQPASTTDCGDGNYYLSTNELGFSDQGGTAYTAACYGSSFNIYNDLLTASTLMRWGNYNACTGDPACGAVRFVPAEVPSGLSVYANAVPSSQVLPPSLFLPARPAWWPASTPWPAIGPDVSGGNVAALAGHVYLTPAANCYLNVMGGKTNGSSGALTFNANNCYSSSAPMPPTNFSGTVLKQ